MHDQSLQSCPTLCDPVDRSPQVLVHGILQAWIVEWVTMPSFQGSSWPRDPTPVSGIPCIGRWVPYHWCHLGSPYIINTMCKITNEYLLYNTGNSTQCTMVANGKEFQKRGDICTHIADSLWLFVGGLLCIHIPFLLPTELLNNITAYT